jgi:hypothetical protein
MLKYSFFHSFIHSFTIQLVNKFVIVILEPTIKLLDIHCPGPIKSSLHTCDNQPLYV